MTIVLRSHPRTVCVQYSANCVSCRKITTAGTEAIYLYSVAIGSRKREMVGVGYTRYTAGTVWVYLTKILT